MGGGDLNLKKSWHTGLLSNQRKVWEAEQQAIAERKKIEQVRREREEERQIEEIAKLAEAHGGTKRRQRVEWMYGGPTAGDTGTAEEQEAYLLGKRRVDNLLKKDDAKQLEKATPAPAESARDITAKVALDPLLLIEKQRQEALEKAMAVEANVRKRKHRHDKDEHTSDRGKRHGHRRRHRSRSHDGSRSPTRHDHHRRYRSRQRKQSKSPRRLDRRDTYRQRNQNDEGRRRSVSPGRRRSQNGRFQSPERRPRSPERETSKEEERAAKLAMMQNDASSLEADRARRLAALEQQDAQDMKIEEKKRGKGTNFKATLYQQTSSIGLEGRLKGSRDMLST